MASSIFIGYFGGVQITSDGTTTTIPGSLAVTGQFLAADGTVSVPAFSFTSEANTGMYRSGTGTLSFTGTGTRTAFLSGTTFCTNSLTLDVTNQDVVLSRPAANRLRLATGDVLNLQPVAFTGLPTGAEGDLACVTDSNTATWGATIAGGGANNVLAYFNGTNWTVAGA